MPRNEKAILVWEYEGGATNAAAQPDRGGHAWRREVPGGMTSGAEAPRLRRALQFGPCVAAVRRRAATHTESYERV